MTATNMCYNFVGFRCSPPLSNEDQSLQCGLKGEKIMKPNGRGAGIMLSDFVEEKGSFLALIKSEYQGAKTTLN